MKEGKALCIKCGKEPEKREIPKEQKQEETKDDEENEYKIKAKIAASAAILVFYNICPFVFICILVRNKKQLDSDECRGRYGSMY